MNIPCAGANLLLRLEALESRMMEPRGSQTQRDETPLYLSSKRYRKWQPELACSSRASPASPFVRIDSSSCGSRLALPQSSARLEYTPSREPHRTPATAEPLRIGGYTSRLVLGYAMAQKCPRLQGRDTKAALDPSMLKECFPLCGYFTEVLLDHIMSGYGYRFYLNGTSAGRPSERFWSHSVVMLFWLCFFRFSAWTSGIKISSPCCGVMRLYPLTS